MNDDDVSASSAVCSRFTTDVHQSHLTPRTELSHCQHYDITHHHITAIRWQSSKYNYSWTRWQRQINSWCN